MATCPNCGTESSPQAAVCPECGTKLARAERPGAQTMLGMASPFAAPALERNDSPNEAPADVPRAPDLRAARPGAPATGAGLQGTMIGMPSPLAKSQAQAPAPNDDSASLAARRALSGTMMGMPTPVAKPDAPGSALTHDAVNADGEPVPPTEFDALRATHPQGSPPQVAIGAAIHSEQSSEVAATEGAARRFAGTLLGVARPGIAPSTANEPAPPTAAQLTTNTPSRPPSSMPPSAPSPFPITGRPPWQSAVLIGAGLVCAAAVGGVLAKMSRADVHVQVTRFAVDDEGHDRLELSCERCADGTVVRVDAATAKFDQGKATLVMSHPLSLGQNEFDLSVIAPGGDILSADPLLVPVAFRMTSSWKGRSERPPFGEIFVQAPSGSQITIDGKKIPDQDGKAVYRVVVDEQTLGESREAVKVALDVPIEVKTGDKTRTTRASLRSLITPLSLSSVGPTHELSGKAVSIVGVSSPGARVSFDGRSTRANERGEFTLSVDDARSVDGFVEANLDDQLMRRVPLELSEHVEKPANLITDFGKLNEPAYALLSGTVIESRVSDGVTRALLELEKDCQKPPCLVSVTYAEPRHLEPNREVTVLGWATPGDPVVLRVTGFR